MVFYVSPLPSPNPSPSPCGSFDFGLDNPLKELEHQIKIHLKYLQSTIFANSLGTVSQIGTCILEKITDIDRTLKSFSLNKRSPLVDSGLNQVYQSVAKLIKLCDDLLLKDENKVNKEYVTETVKQVEDSIQNLVTVTMSPNELRILGQTTPKMSRSSKVQSLPQIPIQDASDVTLPRPPDLCESRGSGIFRFNFVEEEHIKPWDMLCTPTSDDTISWHGEYLGENQFLCQCSGSENGSVSNSPTNEAPPLTTRSEGIDQEFTDSRDHSSHPIEINIRECNKVPDSPPPLPMTKKEITIFMEMFEEWQEYKNKGQYSSRPNSPYSFPSTRIPCESTPIQETCPSPTLPPKLMKKRNSAFDEPSTSTSASKPAKKFQTPANVPDLLGKEDVRDWLVFENREGDGPIVGGGYVDALIVWATKVHENDLLFLDTFLITYRTFITPVQLIEKLIDRYHRFNEDDKSDKTDESFQRVASQTISLLIRIVGTTPFIENVEKPLVEMLSELQFKLIWKGNVHFAKALRKNFIEKYLVRLHYFENPEIPLPKQFTLLTFKSIQIAEQMTLLDAELFSKIEISEILVWIQEQRKENSPNLMRFIEHFNKISFWARLQILNQGKNFKRRNRYVSRFIEIINNLKQLKNFYSSYALVLAIESMPIRRLDLQENVIEERNKCSATFDTSSNFKAYRHALAVAQPPCIPYLGIILRDLTYAKEVKENIELLTGMVNFSKIWRMFGIVKNMDKFKQKSYKFETHKNIITFFNNFDESLGITDDKLWEISESIQPRTSHVQKT